MALNRYSKKEMACRVANELQEGWVVNVGIGMPLTVLPFVSVERGVIFHSENGIIGMGPELEDPSKGDTDLLSAGKRPVSLIPGGSFVHHADSFLIARGGKLDAAILGAYQVASNGDLANWKLPGAKLGSIGGAMDIAVGARRVFVVMSHTANDGTPKILETLSYPVTARGCVTKIFTDIAVISVTDDGLVLEEMPQGVTIADVQNVTAAPLIASPSLG